MRDQESALASHEVFKATRFFTPLDGVRAVSVILVVLWHMPEKDVFGQLNGYLGVNMFFVLSGFLITTLCVREAARTDGARFDLAAFYIRRIFRILPLYVLTVVLAAVVVAAFGLLGTWDEFVSRVGYYLTLSADLVHNEDQPLRHTWSLGIEEKFYFFWPLALMLLLRVGKGWRVLVTLCLVMIAAGAPGDYVALYFPITVGCLLAFVFDWEQGYRASAAVASAGHGVFFAGAIVGAALVQIRVHELPNGSALYTLLTASVIGFLMIRASGRTAAVLSSRSARWIGKRSYGIYLLHPFVVHTVDRAFAPDDQSWGLMTIRLAAVLAGSFVVADLAHRAVEVPLIRRGHRIARRRAERRSGRVVSADQRNVPAEA